MHEARKTPGAIGSGEFLLLLVNGGAGGFLPIGTGLRRNDGASLTIFGNRDLRCENHFVALFAGGFERVVVDFLVSTSIRHRIAGDRIVFAVVLPRPLVVRRFAIACDAIERNLHAVT